MNVERLEEFFKPKKEKIVLFLIFIVLGVLLQTWEAMFASCLKILCPPIGLGIVYYIFWPFQLFNILILQEIPPYRSLLFFARIIFFVLQLIYWYIIACLISIPLSKQIKKSKGKKEGRKKENERKMKETIERDVKHAKELDKKIHKK